MRTPDVFHIGYHRTGTTFLREHVFPQYWPDVVRTRTASFFKKESEFARGPGRLEAMLPPPREGSLFVECSEGLSGDLVRDRLEVAGRIAQVAPDARIVICLRSQYTMLPSLYFQYLKAGGRRSFRGYVDEVVRNKKLQYSALVGTYREHFGEKGVKVLLYEDLQRDPDAFLRELFRFFGVPPRANLSEDGNFRNERPPPFVLRNMRWGNFVAKPLPEGAAAWVRRAAKHQGVLLDAGLRRLRIPQAGLDSARTTARISLAYAEANRRFFDTAALRAKAETYGYPGFVRSGPDPTDKASSPS